MPAHDSSNPGRLQRFDAKAAIRGLRLILAAPALAFLLVLAAAGAASAADGLDLPDAAKPVAPVVTPVDEKPTVAPIVSGLKPVKDRAVKTVTRALPDGSGPVTSAIVRGVNEAVRSAPAPVPIPPVIIPDLPQDPDRDVGAGALHPRPSDDEEASAALPPEATTSLGADEASSLVANLRPQADENPVLRLLESSPPLHPFEPADAAMIGSGSVSSPWLADVQLLHAHPAWGSGSSLGIPLAIRRGLTPRPLVPPG